MLTFPKLLTVVCRLSNFPKIQLKFGPISFVKVYSTSHNTKNDSHLRNIRYPKLYKGNLKTMKLDSEHFKALFTPELLALSRLFTENGFELRMAGGAVRDLLMDKMPADVDFATTATPQEMKELFERESIRMINMRGEKHGTITARINDKENFEITTLRIDVSTDGRHAEVEFTKNWELDAGRRDLTINSMYLDLDGTVHDYFSGMEDLKNLVIRFVGDPKDRIQEDYLRILRYFRFYGRIIPVGKGSHDQSTLQAIRENVDGLRQISGERLWSELQKILLGNHAVDLLLTMLDVGIGKYLGLPINPNIENYKMLIERLKSLDLQVKPITSLCGLLYKEEDGLALHARLRLSTSERDTCIYVLQNRERVEGDDQLHYYQAKLIMSNIFTPDVHRVYITEVLKYRGDVEILKQLQEWKESRFPVNGRALLQRQVKNRSIGPVMTEMKLKWIESNFTMTENDLLQMLQLPEIKALCEHVPSFTKAKKAKK